MVVSGKFGFWESFDYWYASFRVMYLSAAGLV